MGSVAFYIGSLKKGGAERVFVNLATYFLEQGCNVTMVTQYKKENEYELPAGIRRVISDLTPEEEGGRIANLFRRYRKLRRIFREIHADVVLSTIGKNNFMALLANAFLPTKVVVSVVAEPTEEYPTKGMASACKNTVLRGRRNRDADGGCSAFFSTVAAEKMRDSEKFPESGICAATV